MAFFFSPSLSLSLSSFLTILILFPLSSLLPPPSSLMPLSHDAHGAWSALQANASRINHIASQLLDWYKSQSRPRQVALAGLCFLLLAAVVALFFFHVYFFKLIIFAAEKWHSIPYGLVLLFVLIFIVGFPPLIGYTALSILTGMVYGFFPGWFLAATALTFGSFASFLVYRNFLQSYAQRFVDNNEKFKALAEVLRQDASLMLLILIRLCPLPYSLSNGALASIPELSPLTYFMASVITSPKLFFHLFVGYQMKDLSDDSHSGLRKALDVVSVAIAGVAALAVSYIIYYKVQAKLDHYHLGVDLNDENIIFGNFNDEESTINNLELNSADYDADNFIIDDPSPKASQDH